MCLKAILFLLDSVYVFISISHPQAELKSLKAAAAKTTKPRSRKSSAAGTPVSKSAPATVTKSRRRSTAAEPVVNTNEGDANEFDFETVNEPVDEAGAEETEMSDSADRTTIISSERNPASASTQVTTPTSANNSAPTSAAKRAKKEDAQQAKKHDASTPLKSLDFATLLSANQVSPCFYMSVWLFAV